MGWWPSIFGGGNQPSDPIKELDPKLREFLEKESPVKYPKPALNDTAQQHGARTAAVRPEPSRPTIPSESLYQDGRYAHLWKNYRPKAEVDAEVATDHEKLMGVLEGYRARKEVISTVAMENCAEQQEEWINCMKHGKWEDQVQMCRHQVRRFERCFTMQSRFLRALGYGSVQGRAAEVEDDIQMHADALFQRMLQHEEAVKKAKEDGKPIPIFNPALPAPGASTIQPTEELEKHWRETLSKLPEDERVAEEAALRADLQAKADVAKSVKQIYDAKKEERKAQPAEGAPSWASTITTLIGGGKGS